MVLQARLGVEIGCQAVRAVRLGGWGRGATDAIEVEVGEASEQAAVDAIRRHLGPAASVRVALDGDELFFKRLHLPPLPVEERRRMVVLEPERFFPVRGEEVVAAVEADDDLVFASRREPLEAWVTALEALGPVDWIEPAPASLARACARSGVSDGVVLHAVPGSRGTTVLSLEAGRLKGLRRILGDPADAVREYAGGAVPDPLYLTPWSEEVAHRIAEALPEIHVSPLTQIARVPARCQAAYGVALRDAPGSGGGLMPAAVAARVRGRERRRTAVAMVAGLASVLFLGWAVDHSRAGAAASLAADIAVYTERAAVPLALQREASALTAASGRLSTMQSHRPDPLRVLQTLTRLLPEHASIQSMRARGDTWEIDGYARDAAGLIPAFEASPVFEGVRFRSATSRIVLDGETYETYALVFRYVPTP